jgi:signal transduction histidine kinase
VKNASIFSIEIAQIIHYSKLFEKYEHKVGELKKAYAALENIKHLFSEKEKLADIGIMMSNMAHEINNPLTAVIGYADLLLHTTGLHEEMKEQLQIIFSEAHRCHEMVNDLLLYSRSHQPRWQKTDLIFLVKEILQHLNIEINKYDIQVELKNSEMKECIVDGDLSLLMQVFTNLIKNAVQALEIKNSGRRIIIEFLKQNKQAVVNIRDNGPGIPAEIFPKIFTPFFTTKTAGNGTGLGLSICKSIIKKHGGSISVDNHSDGGAVFELRLPFNH